MTDWKNKLYYGDNLEIMRDYIADESVDLVYLDPPFNSKASYNVLFKEKNGSESSAQIEAFDDTWHWDIHSEQAYNELVTDCPISKLSDLIQAFRSFLGTNDMMAYLTMMAIRLVEMHRVLKPTGSIYLHCDPTASHYLKLVLDAVFGANNFRNDILWKRSTPRGNAYRKLAVACDNILFFTKSESYKWNMIYGEYRPDYIEKYYSYIGDNNRRFQPTSLLGHHGVNPIYEWKGLFKPWRYPKHRLDELEKQGKIYWPSKGKVPRLKRYLDEQKGQPLQSLWDDIPPVNSQAAERLGYPTQKPEALLVRILNASSDKNEIVLDPFCGCGTTISVAEKLHRKWIGIDITHLAISLMKHRLESAYEKRLSPYEIIGDPKDSEGAKALAEQDKYQFEWWALSLIGARPAQGKKKGADSGIDGIIYFFDDESGIAKKIVVQVKGGHVTRSQVAALKGDVDREKAAIGVFITLNEPTKPMKAEAAETGFYEAPDGSKYPKIQIFTTNQLLDGKEVHYPRYSFDITHKKAQRASKQKIEEQTKLDLQ